MDAQNTRFYTFTTSLGTMAVGCTDTAITHLHLVRRHHDGQDRCGKSADTCIEPDDRGAHAHPLPGSAASLSGHSDARSRSLANAAITQITEYLEGTRRNFTLPLAPQGTPFQQKVWDALRTIPYGETRCYREIAEMIGNPKACRAVGMANNRNPIIILIPCHRVIGRNGSLVGYGCGLDVKQRLLELEGALPR